MNINEIRDFIKSSVKYRDWVFSVNSKGEAIYLQIRFMAVDTTTGKNQMQSCRKWLLSEHMTVSEIVRTCWKAVQAAVEHEAAEEFKFLDQPVYSPHYNVMRIAYDMEDGYDDPFETIFDIRPEMRSTAVTSPEIEKDIQDEINDFNFRVKVIGASDE